MKTDTSKSTILVISMGLLLYFIIFSSQWTLIASLIIGLIGIFSPYLSGKIEWAWLKLAKVLEFVVPNILLSIVFFLVLFPISLMYKLFNKDALMLSDKYDTYFISNIKSFDKNSFEKIW